MAAIEMLYTIALATTMLVKFPVPPHVFVDNSGAHRLCFRDTAGSHSRHVQRKEFKMKELRAEGHVLPVLVPTEVNFADLFTKVLTSSKFWGFLKVVMNLPGKVTDNFAKYLFAKAAKGDTVAAVMRA